MVKFEIMFSKHYLKVSCDSDKNQHGNRDEKKTDNI